MPQINAENSQASPAAGNAYSVYEILGGKETFRRLAEAFYRRVEKDALLRPMYPRSMDRAVDHLALFLAQFFGGPREYSDARGHPRLKMRHVRFHIGKAERDAWLTHMCAAMEELEIQEPVSSIMRQYFDQASTFLINAP